MGTVARADGASSSQGIIPPDGTQGMLHLPSLHHAKGDKLLAKSPCIIVVVIPAWRWMHPTDVHPQGFAEAKLTEWKYKSWKVELGLVCGRLARGILHMEDGRGSTACERHSMVPWSHAGSASPSGRDPKTFNQT